MSYEEARKDRKRRRKNENLSLILGLLGGVGRQFMEQKQRASDRKWTEERDAVREQREMSRMQKEQEFRGFENEMNRQNQLQVAQTYASRQDAGGRPSQWLSRLEGQFGDRDIDETITDFDRRIQEGRAGIDNYDLMGDSDAIKELLEQRDDAYALRGYRRMMGDQTRPPADRTGTMNPTSPSAAPSAQQMQGKRQYTSLVSSLRGAYAQNDPMAWEQIRSVYPQLQIPPYHIASPDLFGSPAAQ